MVGIYWVCPGGPVQLKVDAFVAGLGVRFSMFFSYDISRYHSVPNYIDGNVYSHAWT